MPKLDGDDVISMTGDQVAASLGEQVVILALRDGVYYGLEDAGALVWSLLETPRTVAELSAAIQREYSVAPERCDADLADLVDDLESRGLVAIERGVVA